MYHHLIRGIYIQVMAVTLGTLNLNEGTETSMDNFDAPKSGHSVILNELPENSLYLGIKIGKKLMPSYMMALT